MHFVGWTAAGHPKGRSEAKETRSGLTRRRPSDTPGVTLGTTSKTIEQPEYPAIRYWERAHRPWLLEPHRELVHRLVAETPHLSIDRLRDLLAAAGIAVSRDTIWRFLRREGLSFKKNAVRH